MASIPRVPFGTPSRPLITAVLAGAIAACGSPSSVATTSPSTAPGRSIAPTALPTAARSPSFAPTTAPDDLAALPGEHPSVPPGTWRWTGFEPAIELTVEAGWTIGHRHDEFFDLFRGDSFPAIGFARFSHVYAGPAETIEAANPDAVIEALDSNPAVEIDDVGPVTVAGLDGRAIAVRVTAEQTHLFRGTADLNADPGFVSRYHVLAVPGGGVLLVSVIAVDGELDAALTLSAPVLEDLRLAE